MSFSLRSRGLLLPDTVSWSIKGLHKMPTGADFESGVRPWEVRDRQQVNTDMCRNGLISWITQMPTYADVESGVTPWEVSDRQQVIRTCGGWRGGE